MTMSNESLSDNISLRPFLNSFLRDYSSEVDFVNNEHFLFESNEGTYRVNFKEFSILGAHQYEMPIYLNEKAIAPIEFVDAIASNFSKGEYRNQFIQKFINSKKNIEQILEFNSSSFIENYLNSENYLFLGHPFHPYPKCKMGMNDEDILKYSPEFSPMVHLVWIEVNKELISDKEVVEKLRPLMDFDLKDHNNKIYLPMHPWQLENIKASKDFDESSILSQKRGENAFHVQSSMRTLYHEESPFILKFSMDITLTNSVRHLQLEESIRGSQIESVLRKEAIADQYKNFDVLYEPFGFGLKSHSGKVLRNTTVQIRENFNKDIDLENTFLLAGLCEVNPFSNKSKLDEVVENLAQENKCEVKIARRMWFNSFLNNIVDPFLKLACNDGVLLGAHMQNIIIEQEDNLAKKVIFRDCQGTGFSTHGYEKYSPKYDFIKKDNGNILSETECK